MPRAACNVARMRRSAKHDATDLAVDEALAQTRFTHFGYLAWHLNLPQRR